MYFHKITPSLKRSSQMLCERTVGPDTCPILRRHYYVGTRYYYSDRRQRSRENSFLFNTHTHTHRRAECETVSLYFPSFFCYSWALTSLEGFVRSFNVQPCHRSVLHLHGCPLCTHYFERFALRTLYPGSYIEVRGRRFKPWSRQNFSSVPFSLSLLTYLSSASHLITYPAPALVKLHLFPQYRNKT